MTIAGMVATGYMLGVAAWAFGFAVGAIFGAARLAGVR